MSVRVSIPREMLSGAMEDEEAMSPAQRALQRGAQLVEGTLHFGEGPLQRKRHKAQAKMKKWKQGWFKVEPGKCAAERSTASPRAARAANCRVQCCTFKRTRVGNAYSCRSAAVEFTETHKLYLIKMRQQSISNFYFFIFFRMK